MVVLSSSKVLPWMLFVLSPSILTRYRPEMVIPRVAALPRQAQRPAVRCPRRCWRNLHSPNHSHLHIHISGARRTEPNCLAKSLTDLKKERRGEESRNEQAALQALRFARWPCIIRTAVIIIIFHLFLDTSTVLLFVLAGAVEDVTFVASFSGVYSNSLYLPVLAFSVVRLDLLL